MSFNTRKEAYLKTLSNETYNKNLNFTNFSTKHTLKDFKNFLTKLPSCKIIINFASFSVEGNRL